MASLSIECLKALREKTLSRPLPQAFVEDPARFDTFHVLFEDILYDYSKQCVFEETLKTLFALARAADVEGKREAMFQGALVNSTEQRPALHTALRDPASPNPAIAHERERMLAFAEDARAGRAGPITDIVNIGIGGSDLGPAMATRALSPFGHPSLRLHFVANGDGADLGDTLARLDPARTLFIISSKTFSTLETMTNAHSARTWLVAALGEAAVSDHFVGVSAHTERVQAFGIAENRRFALWDFVGGRYSLWSSIGLPLAISIGAEGFRTFLRGGHDIDIHFRTAPMRHNIPILMGLISIWNRNGLGLGTQAIIPYDQRLARFPAYLQQLQMESNGKSVTHAGQTVLGATSPILWGEPGTHGQHAFFQLLHQGTEIVPVDFLLAAQPTQASKAHHEMLVANAFAQGEALMQGRSVTEAKALLRAQGLSDNEAERLAPHRQFSGSRPSSMLMYRQLTPRTLGRLVALYEHKVFVEAALWDINPFDQWGVELGKELAQKLTPLVAQNTRPTPDLDSSTAGLLAHYHALQEA